ncbi:MAG: hypothetical protein AAF367_16340 [Pseudomonadota bacterium]
MLRYLWQTRRFLALGGVAVWAVASVAALIAGWPEVFAAMGAFSLSLGFGVFLTDRFALSEERRYWDSLVETQQRQTWRYLKQVRNGKRGDDPHTLDQLEAQIDESFESLLETKAREGALENYRLEMGFSIIGTLQWGFGAMIIGLLHG